MNSVSRETREIQMIMICGGGHSMVVPAGRISHPRISMNDAVTSISGSAGAFMCSGKHINEFCNSLKPASNPLSVCLFFGEACHIRRFCKIPSEPLDTNEQSSIHGEPFFRQISSAGTSPAPVAF